MFLSWNWLQDFVSLSCTPQEAAERLTVSGSEIESLRRADEGVSGLLVAQVVEHAVHPTKSGLTVTQLDIGDGNPRLCITAAKNVKLGDKIPYAISGSTVKSGLTLGFRDFDGFVSDGMMGSAAEMGVPDLAVEPGILILPADAPLGALATEYLGLDDWILELSITPNRGDLLSYLGVARELCAMFPDARLKELNLPLVGREGPLPEGMPTLHLKTPNCDRYDYAYLDDLKEGQTPLQWKVRLIASGMRPVSPLVDATNLAMLALGQPLHAFDRDALGSELSVEQAREGEPFTTLDGKTRQLTADEMVICSDGKPVALAGIMGGLESEITDQTRRVIVESARFNPPTIMRGARRLGLNSEASYRMARGIDPLITEKALRYFTALVQDWGVATPYQERRVTETKTYSPRTVTLSEERLKLVTGREDLDQAAQRFLPALGFEKTGDRQWSVPSWRLDVALEEDLIEEVARLEGYNEGPSSIPELREPGAFSPSWKAWRLTRDVAVARGYLETITFSFLSPEAVTKLRDPRWEGCVRLANPLSLDLSMLRPMILPSLLTAAQKSVNRGWRRTLRLEEQGRVFIPDQGDVREEDHLCLLLVTPQDDRTPYGADSPDFFELKADLEALLSARGVKAAYRQTLLPWGHSGQSAEVLLRGEVIGTLAQLKPSVAKDFDLKGRVFYAEIDMAALSQEPMLHRVEPSEFPPSYRDVALLVDEKTPSADVAARLEELGAPMVRDVRLFDCYRGAGIPEGKKSLAFALRYQLSDRTLKEGEVDEKHQKVRQALSLEGFELR